jgi:hypothetical protein
MAKENSRLSTDNALKRSSFYLHQVKICRAVGPPIDLRVTDYDGNRQNSASLPGSSASRPWIMQQR